MTSKQLKLINHLIDTFSNKYSYHKIYWTKHIKVYSNGKTHANPLSKIHKDGIKYLESIHWKIIDTKSHNTYITAVFSLTTRKEVNKYEALWKHKSFELPLIRQLPHQITDLLDNKKSLWLKLKSHSCTNIMPETFEDIEAFIHNQTYTNSKINCVWYLKHIRGCRGRQIELFCETHFLRSYFKQNKQKMQQYIIQKEVHPLLTTDGRKFAIRAHATILLDDSSDSKFKIFFHKQCIVLPNAKCYDVQNIKDKSIHIQQIGKKLPKPFILNESQQLPLKQSIDRILQQMYEITIRVFECIHEEITEFEHKCRDNNIYGLYYHLFGFDFMLDHDENVVLLEINSFPAIANGTMSNVKKSVFTKLIKDLIAIVLAHDDTEKTMFHRLR